MAWIRTIDPEDVSADGGLLRRIYDAAAARAGRVFRILRAMSVQPRTLAASIDFYVAVMQAPGALSRRQREMLAVVTSRANDCHY